MMVGSLLSLAGTALSTGVVVGMKQSRTWLALILIGSIAALAAALCVLHGTVGWAYSPLVLPSVRLVSRRRFFMCGATV